MIDHTKSNSNPGLIARMLAENRLSPEDGARLIATMIRDAGRAGQIAYISKMWLGNLAYTDGDDVVLLAGKLNELNLAAEKLHGYIAANYPDGDDPPPTVAQVRAALVDELARYCEESIRGFAEDDAGRGGHGETREYLYDRIAELAEVKAECDRNRKAVRAARTSAVA